MPRTPVVLETVLAALVVLCSLASLAYRDTVGARPAPDDVARLLNLYTSVASGLPAGERIGFVSSVADRARSTAMLYLAQTTTVSTRGYELQRLEQVRDELRRQNALLEVENARLDAPARIETEAQKLGLARVSTVPLLQLEPITANR